MPNAGNTEKSISLRVLTDSEELAAWSVLHREQMRELHIYWHMTREGKRTLGTDAILASPLALIRVLLLSLKILVVLSFCCCSCSTFVNPPEHTPIPSPAWTVVLN